MTMIQMELELYEIDPSEEDETDLESVKSNAVMSGSDWTTETILNQMRRGNIELSPSFQRREAWNDARKSEFVESLFMGLPIPQIVLAESQETRGRFIVIDGKQRLLSIRRFGVTGDDSEFEPLKLRGLKVLSDLNGLTYAGMQEDPKFLSYLSEFDNQPIRTVVVKNWPDEDFLFRVFLRLNSGSVRLNPQELRSALNPGPFIEYADFYSGESPAMRKALRLKRPDFRMRDIELFIRFVAYSTFLRSYRGNLKVFLDDTCKQLNRDWETLEDDVRKLSEEFEMSIDTTTQIFGSHAFRRWDRGEYERPFNRAVFDSMAFYFRFAKISEAALAKSDAVEQAFKDLCESDLEFELSLQSTTKTITATYIRLERWGRSLGDVLDFKLPIPKLVDDHIVP